MASFSDEPFYLSPMDNLMPLWQTPMILLFPIPPSRTEQAIQVFSKGFRSTLEAIPLLKGSIKAVPNDKQKGTLAVTQPFRSAEDLFIIVDRRGNDNYHYGNLRTKGFPSSSFPLWDFTKVHFMVDSDPPVMYAQVTLIDGGLVLAPLIHHCFTDVTGLTAVIRLWATYCKDSRSCDFKTLGPMSRQISREPFASETSKIAIEEFPEYVHLKKAQMGRDSSYMHLAKQRGVYKDSKILSILKEKTIGFAKTALARLKTLGVRLLLNVQSLTNSTKLIYFSFSDLQELKRQCSLNLDTGTWISTMDALSSLIFCCVTESRTAIRSDDLMYGHERRSEGLFARFVNLVKSTSWHWNATSCNRPAELILVVNARKYCRKLMPSDYIGNVLLWAHTQNPGQEISSCIKSVSMQAQSIRHKHRALDHLYFRRILAALQSVPDISKLTPTAFAPEKSVVTISSWRDEDICSFDWGPVVGTQCERVRVCEFFADGMVIPFPYYAGAQPDGGLEVFISLEKKAMKRLKSNAFFNQYAQWR